MESAGEWEPIIEPFKELVSLRKFLNDTELEHFNLSKLWNTEWVPTIQPINKIHSFQVIRLPYYLPQNLVEILKCYSERSTEKLLENIPRKLYITSSRSAYNEEQRVVFNKVHFNKSKTKLSQMYLKLTSQGDANVLPWPLFYWNSFLV